MMAARVRPSRAWFWVAGVLLLAGLAAGAWLFWSGLFGPDGQIGQVRRYHRAPIPGAATMDLAPGGYTVFVEAPGVGDDVSPPRPDVTVTGPDGIPVPLLPYQGRLTYRAAGHEGVALSTLRITAAGTYRLSVDGDPCPGCDVAVGPGTKPGSILSIIAGVLIPLALSLIAFVIILVTAIGRSRSRRRQVQPQPYPGYPA